MASLRLKNSGGVRRAISRTKRVGPPSTPGPRLVGRMALPALQTARATAARWQEISGIAQTTERHRSKSSRRRCGSAIASSWTSAPRSSKPRWSSVFSASQELEDVRRLYNLILGRREERVAIALKRLNSCMTRDDAVDAILDATIGLEVLLGDQENQALSYKLRLRAGALARLSGTRKPADVVASVKKIYEVRSAIVHGLKTKKPKKRLLEPEAGPFAAERAAAADMLRFAIDLLLEHPVYLDPLKIDADLLIEPAVPEGQGG